MKKKYQRLPELNSKYSPRADWWFDQHCAFNPEDEIIDAIDRGSIEPPEEITWIAVDLLDSLDEHDPRIKEIVYKHLWEGRSFRKIGNEIGLTGARCHQLYKQGLSILKDLIIDGGIYAEEK